MASIADEVEIGIERFSGRGCGCLLVSAAAFALLLFLQYLRAHMWPWQSLGLGSVAFASVVFLGPAITAAPFLRRWIDKRNANRVAYREPPKVREDSREREIALREREQDLRERELALREREAKLREDE